VGEAVREPGRLNVSNDMPRGRTGYALFYPLFIAAATKSHPFHLWKQAATKSHPFHLWKRPATISRPKKKKMSRTGKKKIKFAPGRFF
jgi:hypothetical protein